MKHRHITKDEINKITEECKTFREKAFFTIMRQSGLPPHTIKQLKIMHLPKILDPYTPIPCKINVPQEKNPTFIGKEAIKYLKHYLTTTRNDKLTPESLLFCTHKKPNTQVNTKNISRSFQHTAQKLKKHKKITYEVRSQKPSELRLYNLIKFYRKNAKYYLAELDKNHTPKNDEFYRKLYEEKAMPFLEIEPPTPIQMHQLKKQQQELENKLKKIEDILPEEPKDYSEDYPEDDYGIWLEKHPEEMKKIKKQLKKRWEDEEKWRKEYPEETKLQDEQEEKKQKEADEYATKFHIEDLEERVKELENKLKEVENIINKA